MHKALNQVLYRYHSIEFLYFCEIGTIFLTHRREKKPRRIKLLAKIIVSSRTRLCRIAPKIKATVLTTILPNLFQ